MRDPGSAPDVSPESVRTLLVGSRCPVCGPGGAPRAANRVLGALPRGEESPPNLPAAGGAGGSGAGSETRSDAGPEKALDVPVGRLLE
jgi:hypothetical protein